MECAHYGCHNEVVYRGRGRPGRFCSPAHKAADYRRRRRESPSSWSSALTGSPGEAVMVDHSADLDTQVVLAVHEAIMLRNTFARLAAEARPELGVRCEIMASVIGDGLMSQFRGAIE